LGRLEVLVEKSDDNEAVLRDLYDAIVDDASLRPAQKSVIAAQPELGHMGSADIIAIVLNPDLVSALSACVTAWFATRRSRLTLKVRGPAGEAKVEFEGSDVITEKTVRRALDIAEGVFREASQ
jgi:hypothetical protein